MTENQFIVELQNALKRLPEEELNDIIQDIREYFTNGREDGKSDNEIAASLGSPQIIAEELQASYSFSKNEVEVTPINKIITISDNLFTNIDINVNYGSIVVSPSDSSVTIVELIGWDEKLQLSAEVIEDTLFVRLKGLRHWLFMLHFNFKAVTLNVMIPMKLYQSIAMKTDNGRISAKKLLAKKIQVNTDNGAVQLIEIAATTLSAETDNGRIEIDKVQVEQITAKTDNGRIEMRNVDAVSITTETDNGRIVLEHVSGSIVGSTDNGRINVQTDSIDRNMDLQTDNGSILIESSERAENVTIHAKTSHGKIDVFGERNSRTVIGAGEHTIRLKSDNGRITVK